MTNQADTAEDVAELVRSEIESFKDSPLRERFAKYLLSPYMQTRKWGKPPYQEVPCWIVADFLHARGVGVAYCHAGHGENGYFWNLVFLERDEYLDAGNNSCYRTLEELAIDSGYCD